MTACFLSKKIILVLGLTTCKSLIDEYHTDQYSGLTKMSSILRNNPWWHLYVNLILYMNVSQGKNTKWTKKWFTLGPSAHTMNDVNRSLLQQKYLVDIGIRNWTWQVDTVIKVWIYKGTYKFRMVYVSKLFRDLIKIQIFFYNFHIHNSRGISKSN